MLALLAAAAASSAAAQADAVAAATPDSAPNPSTLLADATVATSGASSWYHSTAERRTLAKKRGCNPKKNTSCCRDRKSRCPRWVRKKPTKCAKKGFQGKCRESCDAYWGPETDIEFCTPKGTMAWPGSKEELLAKMGAPAKKPPAGSVDWTTGAPCVCTTYRDGATAEDMSKTGLCQRKLPEYDGLGGAAIPCRSLQGPRCASDYEFCTAHPPSPPPSPPPPPPPPSPTPPQPPAVPGGLWQRRVEWEQEVVTDADNCDGGGQDVWGTMRSHPRVHRVFNRSQW